MTRVSTWLHCNQVHRVSVSAVVVIATSVTLRISSAFSRRVTALCPAVPGAFLVFAAMPAPRPGGRTSPVVVPFSGSMSVAAVMAFPISVMIIVVPTMPPFSIPASIVAAVVSLSARTSTVMASMSSVRARVFLHFFGARALQQPVCLFLAQRCQVGICLSLWRHWEPERDSHCFFFGVLDSLQLLTLLASSFLFVLRITLSVPLKVTTLLPSSYRGHHRVAQVVLAMGRVLDVGPFELAAAAAERTI